MMTSQVRSLNLLDFSTNREKDIFLLDIYSDQSEMGGLSETSLVLGKAQDESCCNHTTILTNFSAVELLV